ncbi:hypothetical protein VJI72_08475, partial [Parvimonas micra]|uniref:hypothetical protein n=1 Tax=Parvimonas micra TaxID=33033 RepID=UPI002B476D95
AETSPTVKVESPGTHYFSKDQVPDMQHLIQLLLVKAGYTEPLVWTLKFVEKQKAGQETPPLSFTGGVKLWGIPIKVKPSHGDNWCHA